MPHSKPKILITSVGAAGGCDLATALLTVVPCVLVADADAHAPGLWMFGASRHGLPHATDPAHKTELVALCRENSPDAIIPMSAVELAKLSQMRTELADAGVRHMMPAQQTVDICSDAASILTALTDRVLPTPRFWCPPDLHGIPPGTELIVRPRRGHAPTYRCHTREQAAVLCQLVPNPLVQHRIRGVEFTADCLVDAGGASVILRRMLRVEGGRSMFDATFHDDHVTTLVTRALDELGLTGACHITGVLQHRADGGGVRLTGAAAMPAAGAFDSARIAGAEYTEQLLAVLLGDHVDHDRLAYRDRYLVRNPEVMGWQKTRTAQTSPRHGLGIHSGPTDTSLDGAQ